MPAASNQTESSYLLHPTTSDEFLFVDKTRTLFKTMSKIDFYRTCSHSAGFLVCAEDNVLDKRLTKSCLTALFLSHHSMMQDTCKVRLAAREDTIVQYGPHSFFLYHADRQEVVRHCPNHTDESIAFKGSMLITAKPGCRFTTR